MKKTLLLLAGALVVGTPAFADPAAPSRFQLSGAAGLNGATREGLHLGLAPSFALNKHFALGADLSYTSLPLSPQARGGANKAYWGLATLTANALPSHRVSPYVVLGYGLGRYADTRGDAEIGRAIALGAGLNVTLGANAQLFVESRFGMMDNLVARDGLHLELPVRFGVRFSP